MTEDQECTWEDEPCHIMVDPGSVDAPLCRFHAGVAWDEEAGDIARKQAKEGAGTWND